MSGQNGMNMKMILRVFISAMLVEAHAGTVAFAAEMGIA
jgi:hypothetical protein